MLKWLAKKYAVGLVNDLLENYSANVDKAKAALKLWTGRLQSLLTCFQSLLQKLDDNKITADEVDAAQEDILKLIKEF